MTTTGALRGALRGRDISTRLMTVYTRACLSAYNAIIVNKTQNSAITSVQQALDIIPCLSSGHIDLQVRSSEGRLHGTGSIVGERESGERRCRRLPI